MCFAWFFDINVSPSSSFLSCCSVCQAHHVCVRTFSQLPPPVPPLYAGAHCVCGDPMVSWPPPTASSTNWGSREDKKKEKQWRTMRCHFLEAFFYFVLHFLWPTGASVPPPPLLVPLSTPGRWPAFQINDSPSIHPKAIQFWLSLQHLFPTHHHHWIW